MSNTFTPGPTPNTVRASDGRIVAVPDGWVLIPPGDASLSRRIKAAGDHYAIAEKKGRKVFSRGIWTRKDKTHPRGAAGRGCGHCLDASSDDQV